MSAAATGRTVAPGDLVDRIARVCHEANRAWRRAIGEEPGPGWDEAPLEQRVSCRDGVLYALSGVRTPRAQHEAWLAERRAQGWTYGPVKDPDAKRHPCLVDYDELPENQRIKDYLFLGIVNAVKGAQREPAPTPAEEPRLL